MLGAMGRHREAPDLEPITIGATPLDVIGPNGLDFNSLSECLVTRNDGDEAVIPAQTAESLAGTSDARQFARFWTQKVGELNYMYSRTLLRFSLGFRSADGRRLSTSDQFLDELP